MFFLSWFIPPPIFFAILFRFFSSPKFRDAFYPWYSNFILKILGIKFFHSNQIIDLQKVYPEKIKIVGNGALLYSVIVFENGTPAGIVTDRDFAIKITAHSYPIDTPVRRIMSSPLISIDSHSDLWTASDLMSTRKVRKLPVIDDEKVVGIITSSDIVKHFANH